MAVRPSQLRRQTHRGWKPCCLPALYYSQSQCSAGARAPSFFALRLVVSPPERACYSGRGFGSSASRVWRTDGLVYYAAFISAYVTFLPRLVFCRRDAHASFSWAVAEALPFLDMPNADALLALSDADMGSGALAQEPQPWQAAGECPSHFNPEENCKLCLLVRTKTGSHMSTR